MKRSPGCDCCSEDCPKLDCWCGPTADYIEIVWGDGSGDCCNTTYTLYQADKLVGFDPADDASDCYDVWAWGCNSGADGTFVYLFLEYEVTTSFPRVRVVTESIRLTGSYSFMLSSYQKTSGSTDCLSGTHSLPISSGFPFYYSAFGGTPSPSLFCEPPDAITVKFCKF